MVCNACNKPNKQVCVKSVSAKNMTNGQRKEILSCLNLKLLNEVQKDIKSDASYLYFSTIESASVFYNTYFKKGLITVNDIHFTIHPTQLRDGTLVTYSFQKINFNNQSTSSSINAQTANNTTMPISSSQANADITNAATTPMPSSQASDKYVKRSSLLKVLK
ncbi:hypothetical protein BD770DRAFT_470564 [Pilaira anomala]|nr:hypothetical protein BD770DRAFT_470564 [Pilaira anomala]